VILDAHGLVSNVSGAPDKRLKWDEIAEAKVRIGKREGDVVTVIRHVTNEQRALHSGYFRMPGHMVRLGIWQLPLQISTKELVDVINEYAEHVRGGGKITGRGSPIGERRKD